MNRYRPLFLVDPKVVALIDALGLVPGPIPASFGVSCRTPLFCEVVKEAQKLRLSENRQLCRELYLRNRSRSRYVHRSYHD